MKTTRLWIDNQWVDAAYSVPLMNPYTGQLLAQIGYASSVQAEQAIESADIAFTKFKETPLHQRADILFKVADLLADKREEAAVLIATEAAKPIQAARGEIERTIQTYRFSAEAAKDIHGETVPMDAAPRGEKQTAFVIQEPLGVVSAITPFNFPFNLVAHKVGPAVAAGNTIVLKPAEKTPLSALYLAELFETAGLPKGVLNIIPGDGKELSTVLTTHEKVKFITFTGSPPVGRIIRAQAGLRRVTLELGSNSPLIIDGGFSSRDLNRIADETTAGAFSYNGQVCISIQRIYVHESIYEPFVERLVARARTLQIGDPLDETTDVSALISNESLQRLQDWYENAIRNGAQAHCGGTFTKGVMAPTILTDVPDDAELLTEEAFGPVVIVEPFSEWEAAIASANNSKFGLNAGVFTKDIQRALFAARHIQSGAVLINQVPTFRVDNMPYGGVKESGTGREGVKYAVRDMQDVKLVSFRSDVYES